MMKKILIIKLGSAGDVLRTTAILSGLKERYPQSNITWLVEKSGSMLLEGNSNIDRVIVYSSGTAKPLANEDFDVAISLDKAREAIELATSINAKEKYGFGADKNGTLMPLNKEAEYSYRLGMDDDLKFYKNKKTYQELIFEVTKLNYKRNPYELTLNEKHIEFADNFFKKNNLNNGKIIIGINTGAGKVFANKNLRKEKIVELIELLSEELNAKIIALGGPLEKGINEYIKKVMREKVVNSGCGNSLKDFAALVNNCSAIIASDTLTMHIAIALKKPVIALFGPTCAQEIDLYNLGYKIITGAECAPCYKNKCDKHPTCMDRIALEDIVESVKGLIVTSRRA